jgi:hypothetical protein
LPSLKRLPEGSASGDGGAVGRRLAAGSKSAKPLRIVTIRPGAVRRSATAEISSSKRQASHAPSAGR